MGKNPETKPLVCKKCCHECGKGLKGLCVDCCEVKGDCTPACKKCCGICTEHKHDKNCGCLK